MVYNRKPILKDTIDVLQKAVRKASMYDDPDDVLFSFIDSIGSFVGAKSALLFDDIPLHFYNWTPQGFVYDRERMMGKETCQDLRFWLKESLQDGEPLLIPNIGACPLLPASMRVSLQQDSVRSLAIAAIVLSGNRIGAVSLENVPPQRFDMAGQMLHLASSFILMMLRNRDHIYRLQNDSLLDQMTGVGNRNAFDAYEKHVNGQISRGIVFADINNLKKTNDEKGHSEGDRLIRETANVLVVQRLGGEVFRIGGDEFVVAWQHLEEMEFRQIYQKLRRAFEEKNIDISLGSYWVPEARGGMNLALKMADRWMYEEKRHSHARGDGRA